MNTDAHVWLNVVAELDWEPAVDAAFIVSEVNNGIVTLTGKVSSYGEKCDAERAVRNVSGVRLLRSALSVELAPSGLRQDAEIERAAENILRRQPHLPQDHIHVAVENGWLILSGELEWEYQRQAAVVAIRYLAGIRGISDKIAIKSGAALSGAKIDFEASLKHYAETVRKKFRAKSSMPI